jgi:hypothetical protein
MGTVEIVEGSWIPHLEIERCGTQRCAYYRTAVIRAAYIPPILARDARMDGAPELSRPVRISDALHERGVCQKFIAIYREKVAKCCGA